MKRAQRIKWSTAMTIYDFVMAIGVLIIAGIIVKGFWAFKRIKQIDQPDSGS